MTMRLKAAQERAKTQKTSTLIKEMLSTPIPSAIQQAATEELDARFPVKILPVDEDCHTQYRSEYRVTKYTCGTTFPDLSLCGETLEIRSRRGWKCVRCHDIVLEISDATGAYARPATTEDLMARNIDPNRLVPV